MKKTLVTEKSGVSRLPPAAHALIRTPDTNNRECEVSALTIKNKQLESDLFRVKGEYARIVDECHEARVKIKLLQTDLRLKPVKIDNENETIGHEHEIFSLKTGTPS